MTVRVAGGVVYLHLVEPGGKVIEIADALEDRPVLQPCDLGGNEDSQMANVWVDQVDDALASGLECLGVRVHRWDPVERLVRWGDVVATGGKDHQRVADALEVNGATGMDFKLATFQLVTDEEILDDGDNLFLAQAIEAGPPALKVQKSLALAVDVGKQLVVLLPQSICRLKGFEVGRQMGAIKAPAPQIRQQVRHPGAAQQPAGEAHGINAGFAGPVGQR